MRIASLLPSATEILYALGVGDSVVGVTHECDFPPEASKNPALIRPRVNPTAPPAELDRQVRAIVGRGESLYSVDDVLLRSLNPDLIITQNLCHVCAASPDDLAAALTRMPRAPEVLSLSPHTLSDVWSDILKIGEATGRGSEAQKLIAVLVQRITEIEAVVAHTTSRPRAACLEWLDPFYVGGHWVPEMVACAGGVDLFGKTGKPSFRVTQEQVVESRPDVMIIMQCGYGVARNRDEYQRMKLAESWSDLPAVRSGRVFAVDANSYFSRSGPRLAEGIAILVHVFHPECAIPEVPAEAFSAIESA